MRIHNQEEAIAAYVADRGGSIGEGYQGPLRDTKRRHVPKAELVKAGRRARGGRPSTLRVLRWRSSPNRSGMEVILSLPT